jgi:hypothetical protein
MIGEPGVRAQSYGANTSSLRGSCGAEDYTRACTSPLWWPPNRSTMMLWMLKHLNLWN